MHPTFLRREQAPPDSLLKGTVVLYRQDGKLWRCSEREWIRIAPRLYDDPKEKVR